MRELKHLTTLIGLKAKRIDMQLTKEHGMRFALQKTSKKSNKRFSLMLQQANKKFKGWNLNPIKQEYMFEESPGRRILAELQTSFENDINEDLKVDSGRYRLGINRGDYKEYFFVGKKMKGRYIARKVTLKGVDRWLFWKPKAELKGSFKVRASFEDLKTLKLPLPIIGELLRPGEYYTGLVTANGLKHAFEKLKSKGRLTLFTTHKAFWNRFGNVRDIAGYLENFKWNGINNSIEFDGYILDEDTARKVLAGLVTGISAGFNYNPDKYTGENLDISIEEGTLTWNPHAKHSFIKPKNA